MRNVARVHAVERDGDVELESDLSPAVRALLERLARIHYVRDQHRIALARLTRQAAEVQAEIARIEGER